jgi:hypothetical protein
MAAAAANIQAWYPLLLLPRHTCMMPILHYSDAIPSRFWYCCRGSVAPLAVLTPTALTSIMPILHSPGLTMPGYFATMQMLYYANAKQQQHSLA